jgi:hypothetical protein
MVNEKAGTQLPQPKLSRSWSRFKVMVEKVAALLS